MKNILCFGDSNTWGYVPLLRRRYTEKERWPMLMAEALGSGYHVIEEGLNGRTTAFTDYLEPYRNALDYAAPCMISHAPLDFVIVMLGSNDTKIRYHVSAQEITDGMENLIKKLRFYYPADKYPLLPQILLAAPGPIIPPEAETSFDNSSTEKVRLLPKTYETLAKKLDCLFFNTQTVLTEKDLGGDGLHLTKEGHGKLAAAFTNIVSEYFRDR